MNLKDISNLELSHIVDLYPWFAAARKERAIRAGRPADASLYVVDRSILMNYPRAETVRAEVKEEEPLEQKVVVVGGDYFSQEEYDTLGKSPEFKIMLPLAENSAKEDFKENEENNDVYTETLAEIYVEQGYNAEAIKIYSKLSLLYPEKSAYFATLIQKLKTEN